MAKTLEELTVVTIDKYVKKDGGAEEAAKGQTKLAKSVDKTDKSQKKQKSTMRDMNFEFLGVMFFGQAVGKIFGDMLKPALDLFGVMDLLSLTLKVLFLPVIEAIFPVLLDIMNIFMNLPDSVKLIIGAIAVMGSVFGSIVGTVGQLVLGIQSLSIAMTGTVVTMGGGISGVAAGLASIIPIVALVTAAIVGAVLAWNTNFGKFKTNSLDVFGDIKDAGKSTMDIITAFMNSDADKMQESFINLLVAFKNMIFSFGEMVFDLALKISNEIGKMVFRVIKLISGAFGFQGGVDFANNKMTSMDDTVDRIIAPNISEAVKQGGAASTSGVTARSIINYDVTNHITGVSSPDDVDRMIGIKMTEERDNMLRMVNGN